MKSSMKYNIQKEAILRVLWIQDDEFTNIFWYTIQDFINKWDINKMIGLWFKYLLKEKIGN